MIKLVLENKIIEMGKIEDKNLEICQIHYKRKRLDNLLACYLFSYIRWAGDRIVDGFNFFDNFSINTFFLNISQHRTLHILSIMH